MSKLTKLVQASTGFGAGAAILECVRVLRLSKQHAAVDILVAEYERIRESAQAAGSDHGMTLAPGAEADIISDALRPEPKLPKSWPFPKNSEEALI